MRTGIIVVSLIVGFVLAGGDTWAQQTTESFDSEPGWEGVGNREAPQDFGWSNTNFAGGKLGAGMGELGGTFSRQTLAYYAIPLDAPLSLDTPLEVSGRANMVADNGGNWLLGWFNPNTGAWPPSNFIGIRNDNPNIYARYGTQAGPGGETLQGTITIGEPFTFKIVYSPDLNGGIGRIDVYINGESKSGLDLVAGDREAGAELTHFGVFTLAVESDPSVEVYFDDLVFGEGLRRFDFNTDPGWIGLGNREDPQNFGWSETNLAGGAMGAGVGEIGGIFSRLTLAYYAFPLPEPLSLDQPMQMSGKLTLVNDMGGNWLLGWFNPDTAAWTPSNYIGIRNDNPRIYIRYGTSTGVGDEALQIADLPLGEPLSFSMIYDPDANGGRGRINLSVDGQSLPGLDLGEGHKDLGATLTHFGIFSLFVGSDPSFEAYFDDLVFGLGLPSEPILGVSPNQVAFVAKEGGANPGPRTFSVANTGGGTLNYSISPPPDAPWISVEPLSGSSTGEKDEINVAVDISGLTAGTHEATVEVIDEEGNVKTVLVRLDLFPAKDVVALWLFDQPDLAPGDTITDLSYTGNDLTLGDAGAINPEGFKGGALEILPWEERPTQGAAAFFDQVGTPLDLGNFDWTFECYFNITETPTGPYNFLITRSGGSATVIQFSMDFMRFINRKGGYDQSVPLSFEAQQILAGFVGGWHHLAVTYTAQEQQLRWFIDGFEETPPAPGRWESNGPGSNPYFSLGIDINGDERMPGLLDEVRISSIVQYPEEFVPPEGFSPGQPPVAVEEWQLHE